MQMKQSWNLIGIISNAIQLAKDLCPDDRIDELNRGLVFKITKERLEYESSYEVYVFPQMWGSTACGFGGLGGQAFTKAYTVVIHFHIIDMIIIFINSMFAYYIFDPGDKFFKDLSVHKLPGKAQWEQLSEEKRIELGYTKRRVI